MPQNARALAIDTEFADVDRRHHFEIPAGVIYLDGNSLGPLTTAAREWVQRATADEWGRGLIRSWNTADWVHIGQRAGDAIAPLIGAAPGTVMVGDSTTLNLYKALHAAIDLQPSERNEVITDVDNFPTDLYIVDRVCAQRGFTSRAMKRSEMLGALSDRTSVLTLTHVDYRSAEMADMLELTRAAHAVGALVIWDLAHSAGAVPVDLAACDADFAVGCGYKYLNGGPGAPAFVYIAPRWLGVARQPIEGWHGHAQPFAFAREYEPAPGREQFQVGTQPVLAASALLGALSVFEGVDVARLHAKSIAIAGLFHDLADELLAQRGFGIFSHRDGASRGSHVALTHSDGYAIVQALIARGIIGDFRRPDVLRFGIAPLYNSAKDIVALVEAIIDIADSGSYAQFRSENAVI